MQLEPTDTAAVPAPASRPAPRSWPSFTGMGPLAGLLLVCIAGTFLNENFASLDNAMNVLTRTAFIGIIAVGMCFVIISGGIDHTIGFRGCVLRKACVAQQVDAAHPAGQVADLHRAHVGDVRAFDLR